jgi:hypothetical protein
VNYLGPADRAPGIGNLEKRQLLVDERVGQLRKQIYELGQRNEQLVAHWRLRIGASA